MAEYYALLNKAVSGLENNTHEARKSIYDKARHALIVQLKAIDPPLNPSEISRQRLELEEAIRKVEREAASGGGARQPGRSDIAATAARALEAALAEPDAEPPPAPPPPAPRDDSSPQETFRRAVQEAGRGERRPPPPPRESEQPRRRAEEAVPPAATRAEAGPQRAAEADELPSPSAGPPVKEPAPDLAPEVEDIEPEPARPAPQPERPAPAPTARPVSATRDDWGSQAAAGDESLAGLLDDERPARGRRGRRRRGEDEAPPAYGGAEAKPSRLPSIIMAVLIIAVLGAIGAVGWTYRDTISDLITSFGQPDSEGPAVAEGPAPPAEPAVTKDDDRLLSGSPERQGPVRVVGAPQGAPDAAAPAESPDQAADDGVAPDLAAADEEPGEPVADDPGLDALPDNQVAAADVPVAQKAILYEEPVGADANAQVIALNASVTWEVRENATEGPTVVAHLDVPERNMKITMSVKRNLDTTLPASHMIEIQIDAPPASTGGGIKAIPRLVFKPTEESRGQPLVGQPIQVTDNLFWIALSSDPAEENANLGLIRQRSWIDLPLLYGNDQRAILTFEKGIPGERAFDRAIAAWTG